MSQNDFTIANQTFPNTRADINSALQALASTSSGSSAPSTTFANQFFYNTTSNLLQIRNEDNDAFITIAELDQTNDTVEYFKSDSVRTALIEFTDGDDALAIADGGALTVSTSLDMNGTELFLDADADTSITASTDDQIDFKIAGSDHIKFTTTGITVADVDSAQPTINLFNSNADAGAAHLDFTKDSASPAANDQVGVIRFVSDNDAGQATTVAQVIANITDVADGTENGRLGFETMVDGTIAERMTLNQQGRLGIGTGSPSATLQVNAPQASGTVDLLNLRDASAGAEIKFTSFGDASFGTSQRIDFTGAYLQIRNGTDQALRIDSAERILMGAMTGNNVNGSSAKAQISYVKNSEFGLHIRPSDNNTGGGQPVLFQNQAGTSIGSISCTASATNYGESSDYRLKENVDYTWDATTRLKQLKPARYNWIIDDTNTLVDGFLAHEVSSIVPNAVTGTKDASTTRLKTVKDADGNFIASDIEQEGWTAGKADGTYPNDSTWTATEEVPDYQGIDLGKLVPLLVKTIQELEARITALEG